MSVERPGFEDPLLPMANQPGVRLNGAEEARLELAWRCLQLGKPCQRKRTNTTTNRQSRGCGGCRRM